MSKRGLFLVVPKLHFAGRSQPEAAQEAAQEAQAALEALERVFKSLASILQPAKRTTLALRHLPPESIPERRLKAPELRRALPGVKNDLEPSPL